LRTRACTLPNVEDKSRLTTLADFYYRIVTFLLAQEKYDWEDDKEWKRIALHIVSSDACLSTLPVPLGISSAFDFHGYLHKTKEMLLNSDQLRDEAYYWNVGRQQKGF
jgi:hypothetical protein